jgi:hypothetical protein
VPLNASAGQSQQIRFLSFTSPQMAHPSDTQSELPALWNAEQSNIDLDLEIEYAAPDADQSPGRVRSIAKACFRESDPKVCCGRRMYPRKSIAQAIVSHRPLLFE